MPKIEFVMVADHAEVANNKLYVHGGAWTDIPQPTGPDGKPVVIHMGIAASVLVGWNETNRRFPLRISVMHEDGQIVARIEAQIEAGRPPGIPAGSDLRSLIGISANLAFPRLGTYEIRTELNPEEEEHEVRTASFRVNEPRGGIVTVRPFPPAA
jgi:hypothetical protein